MVQSMDQGGHERKETWLYRHALQLLAAYSLIWGGIMLVVSWIFPVDVYMFAGITASWIFGYAVLVKLIWGDLTK